MIVIGDNLSGGLKVADKPNDAITWQFQKESNGFWEEGLLD